MVPAQRQLRQIHWSLHKEEWTAPLVWGAGVPLEDVYVIRNTHSCFVVWFFFKEKPCFSCENISENYANKNCWQESSLSVGPLPLPPTSLSYLTSRGSHKTESWKLKTRNAFISSMQFTSATPGCKLLPRFWVQEDARGYNRFLLSRGLTLLSRRLSHWFQ